MNKLIYLLLSLIVIGSVVAFVDDPIPKSDKFIMSIPDCYNVSIYPKLISGDYADVTFKDCSLVDKVWVCDCHNTNPFLLYVHNSIVALNYNESRIYKFDIVYSTYDLSYFNDTSIMYDFGNNFYFKNHSNHYVGNNIVEVPYYVDRIITKNVPEYVDRIVEVNKTIYINDTTSYDTCNLELDKAKIDIGYLNASYIEDLEKDSSFNYWSYLIISLLSLLSCMCLSYIFINLRLMKK